MSSGSFSAGNEFWRLVRYAVTGFALMAAYLGVAMALSSWAGLPAAVASPLSFALCLPLAYLGQALFVFRAGRGDHRQLTRFGISAVAGFALALSVPAVVGAWFVLPPVASFLIVSVLVPLVNFLALRLWVFSGS